MLIFQEAKELAFFHKGATFSMDLKQPCFNVCRVNASLLVNPFIGHHGHG